MSDINFMEQMEENVNYSLFYPFHIDHDKLLGNRYFNPDYPDAYHFHSYEEVLKTAYLEPHAFYLTSDDMSYYSAQEVEFILKVQEDECGKLSKGYELVTLELDEKTTEFLNKYKLKNNMTYEEAVIDILKKMIVYKSGEDNI